MNVARVIFNRSKYAIDKKSYIKNGSLVVPKGIRKIGDDAFYRKDLLDVQLPDGLQEIGKRAFYHNKLEEVVIPESVTTIHDTAFQFNLIQELTLPEKLITIGPSAFEHNKIQSLRIPSGITRIEKAAFGNNKIEQLDLPNDLTFIGEKAFESNKISKLILPEGLTCIGSRAFAENKIETLHIPESVNNIGYSAFSRNEIVNVTLPSNLTKIPTGAFMGNKLTSIILPNKILEIGKSTFAFNTLTELELPESLVHIDEEAFTNNKLKKLHFNDGLILIGERAFKFNELQSVIMPNTITGIGAGAFSFNRIEEVKFSDGLTTIPDSLFESNKLRDVTIPNRVRMIGSKAFKRNFINEIAIPSSVRIIGDGAFEQNFIHHLTIPYGVVYIGESAFKDNPIHTLIIPDSVKTIGKKAFYQCPNLKNIVFRGQEIYIESGVDELRVVNDKLLILYNNSFHMKVINEQGLEEEMSLDQKKAFVEGLPNGEELQFKLLRYQEWSLACTSKKGVLNQELLNQIPPEIMMVLPGKKEHLNEIKQGLKSYWLLRREAKFRFEESVDLFKACYSLGLFDGDKKHSDYIGEYLWNEIVYHRFTQSFVHEVFDTFQIDKGYKKHVSTLLLHALKDPYFKREPQLISRINNEFNLIRDFIETSYKRDIRNISPRIRMLNEQDQLNEEEMEELYRLQDEIQTKQSTMNRIGLNEVKFYMDNNIFKIREGNEELNTVATYLRGMSQKDFDQVQDIYEQSKGLEKKIIPTKDQEHHDISYQWSLSDNPYNLVLGYIVNCCARKGGAGEDIMVQSMVNPCVQNLILRDQNQNIIAKSTAFYNEEEGYILFNNVEASHTFVGAASEQRLESARKAVYRAVSDQVNAQREKGIELHEVRMGMLRNDIFTDKHLKTVTQRLLNNYSYKNYRGDANSSAAGQGILFKQNPILEAVQHMEQERIKTR